MKKILLLLPLFVLCSCVPGSSKSSTPNSNQSSNDIITEQISKSNYQRYIRAEVVDLSNSFQHNEKIVFNGALSFATYDVTVRYSGVDWETAEQGTWTLKLDIGGGGETIKIYGNVTIEDVSGTCTYRYQ